MWAWATYVYTQDFSPKTEPFRSFCRIRKAVWVSCSSDTCCLFFFTACKDSCSHNMPPPTPSHKRISFQTSATLSSMRCRKIRHVLTSLWKALLCALSAENKQTPLPLLSISCCIIQSSRQQKRLVSSVFRKDKKHKDYEAQVGGRVDSVSPGACYLLRNSCKSAIMPQNNGFQRLMTILCFSWDKLITKLIYKSLPSSLTWRQIPHFGDIKTVPKMFQLIFLVQAESNSLICWVALEFSRNALHCVRR